jgi:hypothetical protein
MYEAELDSSSREIRMTHTSRLVGLSATFCATVALAQAGTSASPISAQISVVAGKSSLPAAYVYVSRSLGNSGKTEIYAFSAAPNGKLTLIGDTPLVNDPENIATSDKYLPGMVRATRENYTSDTRGLNPAPQPSSPAAQSNKVDGSVSAGGDAPGPYRLAVYVANSSRPASGFADMPKIAASDDGIQLSVARAGNLLAVGGAGGLRIFTLNGANPVTAYSGLLTRDQVEQCYWDNDHHLYAISHAAGKLWVFTVTATGFSQAPGSPYKISGAENLVVQTMPW